MERCPDHLTIQALVDREEQDLQLLAHIQRCRHCSNQYHKLSDLVTIADGLKSDVKLPADFLYKLEEKLKSAPFPAALVAAPVFALILFSLLLFGPGYLEWWLSVGITRQVGLILDAFLNLLAFSRLVGPIWVITGLAALVAMELFILNMIRNVEGWQSV
jgi:hypothetical protein